MNVQTREKPAAPTGSEPAKPGSGLLEFIGKVLDQLSLSAWLPATMLVGVASLLVQLNDQRDFDIREAISDLARQPLGILLFLAFALVLTTMVTQAFEFEAIRPLEGYWGTSGFASYLAALRIGAHVARRRRLERDMEKARRMAFVGARERMLDTGMDRMLIDIMEAIVRKEDYSNYPREKVREAKDADWQGLAEPASLRRMYGLRGKLDQYPEEHRVLPTSLGNTLRSFEDQLGGADGGDIRGFVMRNYELIPLSLQVEHSQTRTRLDMYCTLVIVFCVLAVGSVPALWKFGDWHLLALLSAGIFAVFAGLSYGAAIATARHFGATLVAMGPYVTAAVGRGHG